MRVEEEMFTKVLGESVGETLREAGEERVASRARKFEAIPIKKWVTIWITQHSEVGVCIA